jgi:hypothetical protein
MKKAYPASGSERGASLSGGLRRLSFLKCHLNQADTGDGRDRAKWQVTDNLRLEGHNLIFLPRPHSCGVIQCVFQQPLRANQSGV